MTQDPNYAYPQTPPPPETIPPMEPPPQYVPPMAPPPEQKSNKTLIIILVAVAVALLCCCCVAVGYFGWTYGDQILEQLNQLSQLPLLTF